VYPAVRVYMSESTSLSKLILQTTETQARLVSQGSVRLNAARLAIGAHIKQITMFKKKFQGLPNVDKTPFRHTGDLHKRLIIYRVSTFSM
jgi:hypothetical protein